MDCESGADEERKTTVCYWKKGVKVGMNIDTRLNDLEIRMVILEDQIEDLQVELEDKVIDTVDRILQDDLDVIEVDE